ncbi:Metallo-beta-lactamase family protein [Sulfitobacter noctilucae]|uniref:MBL fold metallo-hydrolase n=1 Tax=Sulfitobacter noctilucae TaxID=1342302 RepID=UPI00046ABC60|nr:MBL fold metallo-hydrolase [Sulfitobacter noctilucae]KIN61064.1 Metallo-beta-lactamase family protein [Sulfitobacter noctilucae]
MQLNRRRVLIGLGGMAAAGVPMLYLAQTSIAFQNSTLTSVSDGHLMLPAGMFFDGLPTDELQKVRALYDLPADQLLPPCNLTLLQRGDRTILFDAGSGPAFMPSAGDMLKSLDGLGVTADDITDVVFTHAHPDHLWGILDDFDDLVFPNAQLMMGQDEWDYWIDPDTVNTIGEPRTGFAVGAARRLEAVGDSMAFFADSDEVLPGVTARATYGHTPGHMSFEIADGNERLLVGGDAIGNHHLAFAHPEWASGADQDPEMGIETRMRLLEMLAAQNMPLMGFHLPQGGLGHVVQDGDAYRFAPEEV